MRRPLTRRADANALVDAIRVATDAQCSPMLLSSAERCLHTCLAEVKLLGAATVCKVISRPWFGGPQPRVELFCPLCVAQNISIASHANDGDVKHLRDALASLDAAGAKQPAAVEAASLCQRLDAEVFVCCLVLCSCE